MIKISGVDPGKVAEFIKKSNALAKVYREGTKKAYVGQEPHVLSSVPITFKADEKDRVCDYCGVRYLERVAGCCSKNPFRKGLVRND